MASLVFVTKLDNSDSYYTDKSKMAIARLRELAPAARGSQYSAISHVNFPGPLTVQNSALQIPLK